MIYSSKSRSIIRHWLLHYSTSGNSRWEGQGEAWGQWSYSNRSSSSSRHGSVAYSAAATAGGRGKGRFGDNGAAAAPAIVQCVTAAAATASGRDKGRFGSRGADGSGKW